MPYKISIVTPDLIPEVWSKLEPFLERVISITDGRATLAETLNRALKREATLWIAYDPETLVTKGAMLTKVNQYADARFLTVEMLAGDDFDDWIILAHDAFTTYATHCNCKGLECVGRSGWVRKLRRFGWREKFTTTQLIFNKEEPDGEEQRV